MVPNSPERKVALPLLLLRLSVFLVMLMWAIDKFVKPDHAAAVFEKFYSLNGIGYGLIYLVGAAQLAILIGFVLGIKKRFTYGAVLLFHTVSTVVSFRQFLNPYEGSNLLFFAAWPMLAACFTLFYLRDHDRLGVIKGLA